MGGMNIRGTTWLSHMINAFKRSQRVWWWRAHKHSAWSGRPKTRVKAATTPSLSFLIRLLDWNSLCWPSLLQEGEGITAPQLLNYMSKFPGCLINLQSLASWVKRLNRRDWQQHVVLKTVLSQYVLYISLSLAASEPLLCKFADGGQKKRQSHHKFGQNGRAWGRDMDSRLVSGAHKT